MKLTDESVAKALGKWGGHWDSKFTCPAFTTSLDAITAEIEARKLEWYVSRRWNIKKEFGGYNAFVELDETQRTADHPAEALCLALLAYLKETKHGN